MDNLTDFIGFIGLIQIEIVITEIRLRIKLKRSFTILPGFFLKECIAHVYVSGSGWSE
jgi:hypothetical protein